MQDRFKFRFYDLDKKIMIKPSDEMSDKEWKNVCVTYGEDEWYWCIEAKLPTILDYFDYDEYDKKHFILMQCTGLKDKNEKLIYEGDIVEVQYLGGQIPLFKNEYSTQPEREIFEIFCHPEWLKFYAKNDNYRKTCEIHSLDLERIRVNNYNKSYEIIGNIYQNSELLKE